MRSATRKLYRRTFGALVAGALGFGVTQAVAGPAPAPAAERCTAEMHAMCDENCINEGRPGGYCTVPPSLGVTVCKCF